MTDSAAQDVDGYTSNVKPQNEHQRKRLACETWWNYSPVNTTNFGTNNIIKFQIPTTDVIFDMSRAFITVDYLMPVQAVGTVEDCTKNALVADFSTNANKVVENVKVQAIATKHIYREGKGDPDPKTHIRPDTVDYTYNPLNHALAFPGILDTGTIFSLTEMYMDGNLIWHNDYCQTQSRLWGLNKNDQWIDSQTQTYFRATNTDDKTTAGDIQTIFNEITLHPENKVPSDNPTKAYLQRYYVRKQLKIPLVSLYPQFEVMNGWPSFLVKQILYLQLTISDVKDYLVTLISKEYLKGPYNVNDIDGHNPSWTSVACPKYYDNNVLKPIFRYHGNLIVTADGDELITQGVAENDNDYAARVENLCTDIAFDLTNLVLDNPILYLPAHIPEFKERAEYIQMVNSGLNYGFKYYNILSNTTFFKHGSNNNSMSLMYNSAVNNLEAVNLLVLRDTNEVIYEKPAISTIQVNLGNSWMLAASGTHVHNIYSQDCNLLDDLLKGWGQNDKNYMQTVSSDVIRSYKIPINYIYTTEQATPTANAANEGKIALKGHPNRDGCASAKQIRKRDDDATAYEAADTEYLEPISGAYTLYFDVSPGDELGVASGQYARQINIRWDNAGLPDHTDVALERIDMSNAKLYVCQQTFNTISITPNGVFIKNPFADEFSVQKTITTYHNLNYDESGLRSHGAFAVQHGLGGFFRKIGRGIKKGWGAITKAGHIAGQVAPLLPGKAGEMAGQFSHIVGTGEGLVNRGKDMYNQWKAGSKQHGAMRFRVKAMRHLGPEGYKQYQHKIEKYANKGWAHGIMMRKLRKSWAKQQNDGNVFMPSHGSDKYLPGTKIRRFQFSGIPRFTPGWKGHMNTRPPRLNPFGRFMTSIPAGSASLDNKHGLCAPYHGFFSNIKDMAKKYWKEHVPEPVQKQLEPFKEPAKQLIGQVKQQGKEYLRRKVDPNTYNRIHTAYHVGRKLLHQTGLSKLAKQAIGRRFAPHGAGAYKKWRMRMTNPHVFLGAPHGKSMHKFFAKHYGNKMANRAIKLERAMWAGGNKRVNDGQF